MNVICNECGKVYDLDPDFVERLKGTSFRIRCDECGSIGLLSQMIEEEPENQGVPCRPK